MAKKIIEKIEIGSDWFEGLALKEVSAEVCKLANQYGDDAVLYTEVWGYDGPDEYIVSYERDETAEERNSRLEQSRIDREKKAVVKATKEAKEREQYEKLKKKFG